MKNEDTPENRRGSSPPFQDPEQEFINWMNSLKSIGQRDESALNTRRPPDQGRPPGSPPERKGETARNGSADPGKRSPGSEFFGRPEDESARWQDDGGESGEFV